MRYLSSDLFRRRNSSSNQQRHPTRRRHPHLPPLYYSVQNRRWAEVRRRVRTHPHEIYVQEELSGNTPLHVACRHDPPADVVRLLLRCADVKNSDGAIPLHLAASHRSSADVIRALIEEGPEACQRLEGDEEGGGRAISCPSPTQALTRIGRTPIHYACMSFRGLGVESFQVLLEATIKAPEVSPDIKETEGITDLDEMSLMSKDSNDGEMEEDASTNAMTLRDKTGQTALGLLFRRYRERVRCVIKLVEAHARAHGNNLLHSNQSTAAALAVQADLGELWAKARLIVSTMEYHLQRDDFERADSCISDFSTCPAESVAAQKAAALAASKYQACPSEEEDHHSTGRKFRIVHASVGLTGYGCPPEMIRLAISVHPHQVCEMDEDGRLPIHLAAIAAPSVVPNDGTPQLDDDSVSIYTSNTFMSSYTNVDVKNPFDQIIRILLRHYPESARIPHGKNGRLPFALAIDAGRRTWDDGLKALFNAYPAAVDSRDDIPPHLYPNIFTLIGKAIDENEGDGSSVIVRGRPTAYQRRSRLTLKQNKTLSSVFEVLRAKPILIVPKEES